jgi:hypothetical protein
VPERSFDTVTVVAAPPEVVFDHLADPASYVGLSPLVVAVRDVRRGRDAAGRPTIDYVAVERFRFGPLRLDNPIRVRMSGQRPARLVSDVDSPGGVWLRAEVTLAEVPQGTWVHETVRLRAPVPLRGFALGMARRVAGYRAAELTRRMAPAVV